MTLTDKEIKALSWWINWSKTNIEETLSYTKEMEQSGEIEKGCYQRKLEMFHVILHLAKKLEP